MKKFIALMLCVCMIIPLLPVFAFAEESASFKEGFTYYVLSPDNIKEVGGWLKTTDTQGSYRGEIMYAYAPDKAPATTTFKVPKDGNYYIFAHTRDYAESNPGTRTFMLTVDGNDVSVY
ncbi:MAG: hypothetical protein IJN39_03150, partial [Clostridia bacterium]|nr:hypothetical protein [Clostridia bacterium]